MARKLKLKCGAGLEGYSVKKKGKRYKGCVPPVNNVQTGPKGGLYYIKPDGKKKYLRKGAKVVAQKRQKKINKAIANGMPDLEEHDN